MTFGILEAAGGLGVGLLVSGISKATDKYSKASQDLREGNQDLQLAFDTVEKYGHRFETELQKELKDQYQDLVLQKKALQSIRYSAKLFLLTNRQSCADFRRESEKLKDEIVSRSQEVKYRSNFLNSPIPVTGDEQNRAHESRREPSIPEHGEGAEEAVEADETQEVDCTSLMSSDILYGNQWRREGRGWVNPAPLPLPPVSTT